jgi:hypothetical protein
MSMARDLIREQDAIKYRQQEAQCLEFLGLIAAK